MPLQILGDLSANTVNIDPTFSEKANGVIHLHGTGNVVAIRTTRASNIRIDLEQGSSLFLDEDCFITDLHVYLREGSVARIGARTFAIGKVKLFSHERSEITIGDDCLLGDGLECLTSDMHSIIEVDTGKRINHPGEIHVGNNVWIGAYVILLKATYIGAGCIVGLRSTVMGEIPPNCAILGFPARVIRSGVTWNRDLIAL